jgi:hypothetical protein
MPRALRPLLILGGIIAAGFLLFQVQMSTQNQVDPSSPFRPSDVSLLSQTGKPQLVQFFHHT